MDVAAQRRGNAPICADTGCLPAGSGGSRIFLALLCTVSVVRELILWRMWCLPQPDENALHFTLTNVGVRTCERDLDSKTHENVQVPGHVFLVTQAYGDLGDVGLHFRPPVAFPPGSE